jgi:hypothetical protein
VPIAAIKMLVDGRVPATGAGLLAKSEPRRKKDWSAELKGIHEPGYSFIDFVCGKPSYPKE